MSTTTPTDREIAEARLLEQGDSMIVLALPDSDYKTHLRVDQPLAAELKDIVRGRIFAQARRVDVVGTGGRYIEPVFGRPRRLQGRIVGGDVEANTLVVDVGVPMTCKLMDAQRAADFELGRLVSFDVEPGARFEPA